MRWWMALCLCAVTACGAGTGAEMAADLGRVSSTAPPATTSTTTTTTPPATTTTTTTTAPTTTAVTTTTRPPTTTLPPLPVPAPPPPDDGSTEPQQPIGEIDIPRLDLVRTMYEGIRLSTLDLGPGHWPGTALPGQLGNVVVAGHRVSHNQDFHDLDQLAPGDRVIFRTTSGRDVYRVVSTEIVDPSALWIVDQTYARTATLFACHPPGSVSQRIVVHLEMAKRHP